MQTPVTEASLAAALGRAGCHVSITQRADLAAEASVEVERSRLCGAWEEEGGPVHARRAAQPQLYRHSLLLLPHNYLPVYLTSLLSPPCHPGPMWPMASCYRHPSHVIKHLREVSNL
ncbi:unnamed protein product [Nezara viridula]|uniref:Uncharacterized protein n=1 Tax=Nezara viridula TaxID=85310 RepID=A0A9P0E3Q1_NEZVI|nr:unnamed protein product [Nezara viridula]